MIANRRGKLRNIQSSYHGLTSRECDATSPNGNRQKSASSLSHANIDGATSYGQRGDDLVLDEKTERIMSVVLEGDNVSFAVYLEKENEILLENCRVHGDELLGVFEKFQAIAQPSLVLIGNKVASNAQIVDMLTTRTVCINEEFLEDNSSSVEQHNRVDHARSSQAAVTTPRRKQIPFKILKSSAYDLRSCTELILNNLRVLTLLRQNQQHQIELQRTSQSGAINLSHVHHSMYQSTYHAIAAVVDLHHTPCLVRTLGALISYLKATFFRMEDGETVTVNSVTHANSEMFMRIDKQTIQELHIFSTEPHPLHLAKGSVGTNSKEGFSLYSMLDRCKSKLGRQCLREWMLNPTLDTVEIHRRQNGIELFLSPEVHSSVGLLLNLLQQVGAIDKILLRIQKVNTVAKDFLVLLSTIAAALSICSTLENFFDPLDRDIMGRQNQQKKQENEQLHFRHRSEAFLHSLTERCYTSTLKALFDRIMGIIDVEHTTQAKDAVVIQYGFHPDLDRAKESYKDLDEILTKVGAEILEIHPELMQLKVVFLPQVGFLVVLDKGQHGGDLWTESVCNLPSTFDFLFYQENDAYFKSDEMRRLDEEIGDLESFIKDTESLIKSELEDDILDCELELRSTFSALAELDCILSLAGCAADFNFSRPEVVESECSNDQVIYIENGRHPLQELIVDDDFIKNDTMLDHNHRLAIITGPNFSGKSCYTRQVGVLVYLAHLGSYLPCDRAKISVTDKILARISSVESCIIPQSSFQLDLNQMAVILRQSTPRSLVLIDEFGKGTHPSSGIAALASALRKLSYTGCQVVCTTHFLEMFSLELLKDGVDGTTVLRMAVHLPNVFDEGMENDDNAVPLFKLERGVAVTSAGLVCAKLAGVSKSVRDRARSILFAMRNVNRLAPVSGEQNSNCFQQSDTKAALRAFATIEEWLDSSTSTSELARFIYNQLQLM